MNPFAIAPFSSLASALAVIVLAFLAGLSAGWGGAQYSARLEHEAATRTAQAAQDRAVQRAREQTRTEADAAVQALRDQLVQSRGYHATLEERSRHAAPLLAACKPANPARRSAAAPASAPPLAVLAAAAPDAGAAPAASAPGADAGAGGAGDGLLSLAAVSLWNSALAGHDVPAGACGADDPAGPACAAASEFSIADAWRNQRANAAGCAEDRARFGRLIDYLRRTRGGVH